MLKCLFAWILAHAAIYFLAATSIANLPFLGACTVSSFLLAMYIKTKKIEFFTDALAMIIYAVAAMNGLAAILLYSAVYIDISIINAVLASHHKFSIWITVFEVAIFIGWTNSELRKRSPTYLSAVNING